MQHALGCPPFLQSQIVDVMANELRQPLAFGRPKC
jgi:hypothetical protein